MKKIFITGIQMILSAIILVILALFANFENMLIYLPQILITGVALYFVWENKFFKDKIK